MTLTTDLTGLKTLSKEIKDYLNKFLKIFIFLYADDTTLLAETAKDSQAHFDQFHTYCKKKIEMKVNENKTKILFFFSKRSEKSFQRSTHDYQATDQISNYSNQYKQRKL